MTTVMLATPTMTTVMNNEVPLGWTPLGRSSPSSGRCGCIPTAPVPVCAPTSATSTTGRGARRGVGARRRHDAGVRPDLRQGSLGRADHRAPVDRSPGRHQALGSSSPSSPCRVDWADVWPSGTASSPRPRRWSRSRAPSSASATFRVTAGRPDRGESRRAGSPQIDSSSRADRHICSVITVADSARARREA